VLLKNVSHPAVAGTKQSSVCRDAQHYWKNIGGDQGLSFYSSPRSSFYMCIGVMWSVGSLNQKTPRQTCFAFSLEYVLATPLPAAGESITYTLGAEPPSVDPL